LERWVVFESLSSAQAVSTTSSNVPPFSLYFVGFREATIYRRLHLLRSLKAGGLLPSLSGGIPGAGHSHRERSKVTGEFLAVMSLGWWAHVQDLVVESSLDAAINDVSWVMKQLITSISARTIAFSPLPDPLATSSQRRKRQTASGRADPPRKHLRV
jgi:hypothetical protein